MKKLKFAVIAAAALSMTFAANAQSKYGATPEDSTVCISSVALYQSFYKAQDYDGAYEPWRQILEHCPKYSKAVYQKGETIMKHMINHAENETQRNAYIDEMMHMYDLRVENFGETGKVMCMKANMLSTLRPNDVKTIYEIYEAAIKTDPKSVDENYVTLFFKATVDYVKSGLGDPTLVIDNYDIASELLENIIDQVADDTVKVAKISGYINNVEAVFSPYASCDQLIEIYQKKFDADPKNVDLLKKITNIMIKKHCTENSLFFSATENLYELEPSPTTAMQMGQMCFGKKQYGKAIEYCQDAVKSLTEKKDLYRAYLVLGLSYNGQNSYSAARNALLKAAEIDRTKGEPYLAIAQVYASSTRSIDDGMGGRSAYWAAVDECRHAKSVEPTDEIARMADKLIGIYSGYFPKKNDAFMLDLIDGHSYVVPGWIGKSTIIRTR